MIYTFKWCLFEKNVFLTIRKNACYTYDLFCLGQPEHPRVTIPLPGGPAGQGSGTEQQEQTLPFSKPSDFYPKGYYTHIRVPYVWINFHFSLASYYYY